MGRKTITREGYRRVVSSSVESQMDGFIYLLNLNIPLKELCHFFHDIIAAAFYYIRQDVLYVPCSYISYNRKPNMCIQKSWLEVAALFLYVYFKRQFFF